MPVTGRDLNGEAGEAIAGTMHLLQRRIRPEYAVRLTAVDGQMFAAAIHPHSEAAAVDWRSDYDALSYEVIEAPADVVQGEEPDERAGSAVRRARLPRHAYRRVVLPGNQPERPVGLDRAGNRAGDQLGHRQRPHRPKASHMNSRVASDEASTLRSALVAALISNHGLADPRWIRAFGQVPREHFVPRFLIPSPNGPHEVRRDQDQAAWLRLVYANEPLIISVNGPYSTSSSSQPSLMAAMLQSMRCTGTEHVLEIGRRPASVPASRPRSGRILARLRGTR